MTECILFSSVQLNTINDECVLTWVQVLVNIYCMRYHNNMIYIKYFATVFILMELTLWFFF